MIQISIIVDRAHLERVEQTLVDYGAWSVTLRDAADAPVLEPLPGETPVWPRVIVTGLFGADVRSKLLRQSLREIAGDIGLEVAELAERDWVRASLDAFKPLRFGRRLRIVPGGDWEPDPAAVEVKLDPGLGFGTGTHPTTALCLEWLDADPPTGAEVIDYGCGSGILSLAAVKLGASRVRAVDIDAQARLATRDNAAGNMIPGHQLRTYEPAALSAEPADLLLANILARPLIELAERFADLLKPGARVVLSGVLAEQAPEVIAAYAPWFELARVRAREAWILIEGAKPKSERGAIRIGSPQCSKIIIANIDRDPLIQRQKNSQKIAPKVAKGLGSIWRGCHHTPAGAVYRVSQDRTSDGSGVHAVRGVPRMASDG